MEIVDEIVFKKMDSRIAELMLKRASGNEIAITHHEIASELGTSREVVSRILKDLEKESIIKIDRGKIIINSRLQLKSKIS